MEKLEEIIKDRPTYFISPHLDDAILSAGGLVHHLLKKHIPVTVITVFTNASGQPETMHARRYVRRCGYADAYRLFKERKKEDRELLHGLGITAIHLGFTDAAWRKRSGHKGLFARIVPEAVHLYPLRWSKYTKTVHSKDLPLIQKISRAIRGHVASGDPVIFCPLAVGSHVDHVITRQACVDTFSSVIFWSDFPYSLNNQIHPAGLSRIVWKKYLSQKIESSRAYRTQWPLLFRQEPPLRPEIYYLQSTQLPE